ncbi:hypothetical protein MCQ_01267 [Candidatus Bartonella washoeensis Sb944nv]|uniref:Uncharacterized protein n=1 Tax=Candidatus Bartonella washoeensis Sb944nv TaxID=1094563 RepID=J1J375_9HYPH|nr:hypothetical protein MCQ_01267 [Bartonella washoeensis Sb944nv]
MRSQGAILFITSVKKLCVGVWGERALRQIKNEESFCRVFIFYFAVSVVNRIK